MSQHTYDSGAYRAAAVERARFTTPNLAEAMDELFLRLHAIEMAAGHATIENQDDSAALYRMVQGAKDHRSVDAALGVHALRTYFPGA